MGLFLFNILLNNFSTYANSPPDATKIQQIRNGKMTGMENHLTSEYEKYFDKKVPSQEKNSAAMSVILKKLDEETGTKSAVYWVMPEADYLHLVLLTGEGTIHVEDLYNVPSSKLRKVSEDFYSEINALNEPFDLTLAQQLYRWIIDPFDEILEKENINNLLFCLGKGIRFLPLSALHDGEKYLAEKYNLTRIPAFNLINPEYKPLVKPTILAMGASEFENNTPLPGVVLELQKINQKINENITPENLLINQKFTQPNMKQQLREKPFQIVHLATHADFNPGGFNNSYIVFWDGKLTMDKMSDLPWQTPPELMVLSACNTAIGDEQAELGFTGIALQSGVKSVIGTLWYVSDLGTVALMNEFYEQLINHSEENLTKVQALTKAQNLLIQGKIYFKDNYLITPDNKIELPAEFGLENNLDLSHPFYWAGFTMISNPW